MRALHTSSSKGLGCRSRIAHGKNKKAIKQSCGPGSKKQAWVHLVREAKGQVLGQPGVWFWLPEQEDDAPLWAVQTGSVCPEPWLGTGRVAEAELHLAVVTHPESILLFL